MSPAQIPAAAQAPGTFSSGASGYKQAQASLWKGHGCMSQAVPFLILSLVSLHSVCSSVSLPQLGLRLVLRVILGVTIPAAYMATETRPGSFPKESKLVP